MHRHGLTAEKLATLSIEKVYQLAAGCVHM